MSEVFLERAESLGEEILMCPEEKAAQSQWHP